MALYMTDPYRKKMEITIPPTVHSKGYEHFLLEDSIVQPPVEGYTRGDLAYYNDKPISYSVDENGRIQYRIKDISAGETGTLSIDWSRRLQNMQNNLARILFADAAATLLHADVLGAETEDKCYLLVDTQDVGFMTLEKLENLVNHLIESNLPVVEKDGKLSVSGVESVVSYAPAPSATGELALFAITDAEKTEGGIRLYFLCGAEALEDYRKHRYLKNNLSLYLKEDAPAGIWQAVKKLQGQIDTLKQEKQELESRLGLEQVQEFMDRRRSINGYGYIYLTLENINFKNFKNLTGAIQRKPRTVQIYGIPNGSEAQIHVIRSQDTHVDLKKILNDLEKERDGIDGTGNMYRVQLNVAYRDMAHIMEAFLMRIQSELASAQ